ncbi:MAG: hypothetical protein RR144_04760, partial [Clostridia bacterium]
AFSMLLSIIELQNCQTPVYILPIICFLGTNVIFKNITESTIFNLKYTPYILASVVLISMSIILIKMGYNKIKNNFLE